MTKSPSAITFSRRLVAFWSPPLPKAAAAEFRSTVVKTNLSRLKIFAYCAIGLTPAMLLIDYLAFLDLSSKSENRLESFLILHSFLVAGAGFLILKLRKRNLVDETPVRVGDQRLEGGAVFFLLNWTAVFTGFIHPLGTGVSSYLVAVFVTVAFIVQSGIRTAALLCLSLAVLVLMILYLGNDPLQMRVDILNATGMTLGAILVSQILYRTSVKEFVSDQLISMQKSQVERANLKLKNTNERLVRISFVDPLTGIANRRYLDEYLGREWKRAFREDERLALIMADIDNFKAYNDLYGHKAGDDCLTKVAGVLERSPLRGTDLVARFGGEEFAVILPRTGLKGALELAERMRRAVQELGLDHRGNGPGVVTVSLGAASFRPGQEEVMESLIEAADRELYKAKEGGRNLVRPVPVP